MNFYRSLHKNVITPLSDLLTRWNIASSLSFLEDSQWWSEQQIKDYQLKRLKELVDHAYRNTSFYHDLYEQLGILPNQITSLESLKELPVITKDQVRNNLSEKNIVNSLSKRDYFKTATSGSTGLQLIFNISNSAYGMINATALRGWRWMGFELGDKFIKITQNNRKTKLKKIQDFVNNCFLFTHQYNSKGFQEFIKKINSRKPEYLRSYPDPLVFLAKHIEEQNIRIVGLKGINTTGNILFKEDRELIEKAFNTKIFDSYSCEGSTQSFECPTHNYYHNSDEYAITEILDDNGNEVGVGERGRLITTDLWNYATPFIRYDTNDIVIKGGKCSCGRELSTFKRIIGRNNDIIIVNDSYFIAQNFTTYFKYFEEIKQFKVVQDDIDSIKFYFVLSKELSSKREQEIIDHWVDQFNTKVNLEIIILEKFEAPESGKIQFIFRVPKIKLN